LPKPQIGARTARVSHSHRVVVMYEPIEFATVTDAAHKQNWSRRRFYRGLDHSDVIDTRLAKAGAIPGQPLISFTRTVVTVSSASIGIGDLNPKGSSQHVLARRSEGRKRDSLGLLRGPRCDALVPNRADRFHDSDPKLI
jgi:hypothetical protein